MKLLSEMPVRQYHNSS